MGDGDGREALTEVIYDEARRWEALLAEVGEGRMGDPIGVGMWTFKDLVAHLTAWRMHAVDRLEAIAFGTGAPHTPWPAELTEDDEINAWIDERSRPRSLDAVLNESREGYQRLARAVEAMPDMPLDDPAALGYEDGGTLREQIVTRRFFDHLHVEHEPDIRAWLAHRDTG